MQDDLDHDTIDIDKSRHMIAKQHGLDPALVKIETYEPSSAVDGNGKINSLLFFR